MRNWLSPTWRRRIAAWCPIVAFGAAFAASSFDFDAALAGGRHRRGAQTEEYCPPPVFPSDHYIPPKPAAAPTDPNSPSAPSETPTDPNAPPTDPNAPQSPAPNDPNASMTQNTSFDPGAAQSQAASNAQSASPNMIGDFFGPTGETYFYDGNLILSSFERKYPGPTTNPVGRQKIMENGSVLPCDRAFVNYSYFNNVPLIDGGADVNRFTLGLEKTLFDGYMSVEVRTPLASTVSSEQFVGNEGYTDTHGEIGNLTINVKQLLYRDCQSALACGLGIALPTADDLRIYDGFDGTELMRVQNKSVHLMPFLGWLYTPTSRVFAQTIVQFDFDCNGNKVLALNSASGQLYTVGRANDAAFAYLGQQVGYWLSQPKDYGFLRGVAAVGEVQWSRSMRGYDSISGTNDAGDDFSAGDGASSIDIWNLVMGLHVNVGNSSDVAIAYATPLDNGGGDQQFDGELRLIYNVYFGGRALGRGPAR